jgi:hypothetical protein
MSGGRYGSSIPLERSNRTSARHNNVKIYTDRTVHIHLVDTADEISILPFRIIYFHITNNVNKGYGT